MKLYAQQGHGDGGKICKGLSEGLIDGVIMSPRDILPDRIQDKISEFQNARAAGDDAEVMIDPQFYASFAASSATARLGKLTQWSHFSSYRKSELELASEIEAVLRRTFEGILPLPVSSIISPNIFISKSFDSREAVIAKNFIRLARDVYSSVGGDQRPLLATLAISREALLEKSEFEEFLNDITMIKNPPDGFYVLIGGRGTEARTDIFHTDVIARWMVLNYSLGAVNGFKVINGYSDALSSLLGAVGGSGGASGWWSNLRTFSMERYNPAPGGGRQPICRYLSVSLMNRITFIEKAALSEIGDLAQEVLNQLPHDDDYNPEPDRITEALQSWEALRQLNLNLIQTDISDSLDAHSTAVREAEAIYSEIADTGYPLDKKSREDHLESMREAIGSFIEAAGL